MSCTTEKALSEETTSGNATTARSKATTSARAARLYNLTTVLTLVLGISTLYLALVVVVLASAVHDYLTSKIWWR